jgi:hypothetical protein
MAVKNWEIGTLGNFEIVAGESKTLKKMKFQNIRPNSME